MILEGDNSVIDALKEKKRLMEAKQEHGHIRPLIFVDGGLMKGAYAIGAGLALEELQYNDAISYVVGVSSGAPSAAYFVAKETRLGASLIWEECCDENFINLWRIWNQVHTGHIIRTMRSPSVKAIDTSKVFGSATKLYIAVTDFTTAKTRLINPTSSKELFQALQASILMPNLSSDRVAIDGVLYVDGGFSNPHALHEVVANIDATHLLVMTNQDKDDVSLGIEKWLNKTVYRLRMPKLLYQAAQNRRVERLQTLEYLAIQYKKPLMLVWGDGSIKSIERDGKKVRAVVEKSRVWWRELLST